MKGNINTHHIRSGFTLIELLVVISVIGMLSSVVLASLQSARAKGSIGAGQTFDRHTYGAYYDDLVLAWDFDNDSGNTVKDQSGNGNDLAYYGPGIGPSTEQNIFNGGKSFKMSSGLTNAKTGDYNGTAINPVNIKNPPTGEFSISIWLYPTTNQVADFISSYSGLTLGGWTIAYVDDTAKFAFKYYSPALKTAIIGALPLNAWSQITATCSSGKIGVYVNGRITGTTDTVTSCAGLINSRPVQLDNLHSSYFIDNVRIYKKSLPLSYIGSQYLNELPKFATHSTDDFARK